MRTAGTNCHNTSMIKPTSSVQKPAALQLYCGKNNATITITLKAAVRLRPIMIVPKMLETPIAIPSVMKVVEDVKSKIKVTEKAVSAEEFAKLAKEI